MALNANRLYLITVRYRTVAIIPAKDAVSAILEYLARIGFNSGHRYFCNHLMTNAVTIDTKMSISGKYYVATTNTKTIGDAGLSIDSQQATSCDDIFKMVDTKDINSCSFMRPTIEEVRNCIGFRYALECELRRFCIRKKDVRIND